MPSCLMVASHFPPFQSAGVFRTVRIAKYLPELGWEIQVLTMNPDAYLDGSSTSSELLNQIPAAVEIHRTTARHPHQWFSSAKRLLRGSSKSKTRPPALAASSSSTRKTGAKKRISSFQRVKDAITLPWMTPDRWVGWLPYASREGKRLLRKSPVDVIYSSGPPWTNHLIAERLHRATGTPWVADFRDPWVDNNFRTHRQGEDWVGRQHQSMERRVVESAAVVILNTDRALEAVRDRYSDLPANKFRVIPNGFDPADFAVKREIESGQVRNKASASPLRITHTGAFYGKRNVDALIHAIGDLIDDGRLNRSDLQVDLIGAARSNRTRESDIAESRGIADIVRVLPRMPHAECLQQMSDADLLLLVQTEAPLCIPGKLYEYIAIGRPILTLSADGATTDLVTEENLGPCVDPSDSERLKDCLYQLVQQHRTSSLPQPNGTAIARFDGQRQMNEYDAAFRTAVDSPQSDAANKTQAVS